MIENNDNMKNFDLMMKSILDEGQEEVPAHIWDGISDGLDKAARRKTVVLWWRRAAVTAAAAAAVTAGVFFNMDKDTDSFVPEASDGDMIAVVEPVHIPAEDGTPAVDDAVAQHMEKTLIAKAEKVAEKPAEVVEKHADEIPETATEAMEAIQENVPDTKDETSEYIEYDDDAYDIYSPDGCMERRNKPRGISFELSGLAGTNNTQSQNRIGPMKSPTTSPAPTKTGIEETSTKGSYSIPVSFGAGVKVDLRPRWSIGTGVRYTLLSRHFYGKYNKVEADGSLASPISSDIQNTQQYIGIPVNAFYDIVSNDMIKLYAYAGGAAEKCVSDKYKVLGTDIIHKESISGLQFSANAGIGVEFSLGRQVGIYLDPSLRYYFNNGQPKSIRTVQPLMLGFEMGLRARL